MVRSLGIYLFLGILHFLTFLFISIEAMIGFPGFGLGVEARKRVTIGVELAARPALLLFLDGTPFFTQT